MHMYSESVRVPFLFLHHLRPGNPSVGLARQPCSYSNSGASVSVADPLDVKPMAAVEPCEEFTYGHTNMDTEMNLFIHPFIYLHGSGQPYVYLMKFPAKNTVCNCMYIHIYIYYIYGYGQPYPRLICLPLWGICGLERVFDFGHVSCFSHARDLHGPQLVVLFSSLEKMMRVVVMNSHINSLLLGEYKWAGTTSRGCC